MLLLVVLPQCLQLTEWWQDKKSVLCITGAGLSTESGIPDYRGHKGSYHQGHKPMIHQQYMDSEFQRKRYWGRSMVGWKNFDSAEPNVSINKMLLVYHGGGVAN
jgi:NAD-dependent deacetylase sirtuin 4